MEATSLLPSPLDSRPHKPSSTKEDEQTGQLIQWSIELSEFDIDYRPRTTIKAQALADFVAEFTSKDDEPTNKEEN